MKKNLLIKVNTIFRPIRGKNRYVSGIGRSTYEMLKAISMIKEELPFEIKLYGSGVSCISKSARDLPFNYKCFPLPEKLGVHMTKLEPFFVSDMLKHDLLHIPSNYDPMLNEKMDFIVTMHDTCSYDFIAVKNNDLHWMDMWRFAAKSSKSIVTCSNSSKNDIVDRFHVNEDKVTVIPWGISQDVFHVMDPNIVAQRLTEMGINKKYFFAVSCSDIRKNMGNLLKAFHNYSQKSDEVIMVMLWNCPPKSILDMYSDDINQGKLVFLKNVPDNDLVILYSGALATMFPSRYEGFGFPILESFACGTPVMTCPNSSLLEIGGKLAVYANEDSVDDMTQIMEMFASDKYDYSAFREKAKDYVADFTWERTAKEYVNFYTDCMNQL